MPTKDRAKHVDRAEQNTYGPSWYDVWIVLQELRALSSDRIDLYLSGGKAPNGKASLIFEVHRDGKFMFYCGKRFLDNGAESSKTAAGAAWSALTRAYHIIEAEQELEREDPFGLVAGEAEQDTLFPPEG